METLYYGEKLTIVRNPQDELKTGTLHAMWQLGLTLRELGYVMDQFVYPATLTPDTQDGGFVVTFVDVPEAITQGDDVSEALHQAADCLEEAMVGAFRRHGDIPKASAIGAGNMPWPLPIRRPKLPCIWPCVRRSSPKLSSPHDCTAMKRGTALA